MRNINKVNIIEVKNSEHLEQIFNNGNFCIHNEKEIHSSYQVEDTNFEEIDFNLDASRLVLQSAHVVQILDLKNKKAINAIKIKEFNK